MEQDSKQGRSRGSGKHQHLAAEIKPGNGQLEITRNWKGSPFWLGEVDGYRMFGRYTVI